jgi:hypothetical protein
VRTVTLEADSLLFGNQLLPANGRYWPINQRPIPGPKPLSQPGKTGVTGEGRMSTRSCLKRTTAFRKSRLRISTTCLGCTASFHLVDGGLGLSLGKQQGPRSNAGA